MIIVLVWLAVSIIVGTLIGHAIRAMRGDDE